MVGDETWYNNDAQTGNCNTYAVLYYTIGGTSGGDDNEWTTDPANESTVTSIKRIRLTSNTQSEIACGSGKVVLKKDGVELESISDTGYEGDYGWNELYIETSQEYTEAGTYTFEVPEGFFLGDGGAPLAGFTLTYTIETSGIDSIFTDENATADVYAIDGRLVKSNANKSDFMNLEQGIYIIGNQKVQLRK